jgi:hypothetical protein
MLFSVTLFLLNIRLDTIFSLNILNKISKKKNNGGKDKIINIELIELSLYINPLVRGIKNPTAF